MTKKVVVPQLGQFVIVTEPRPAFYNEGTVTMQRGQVGIIKAVNVPAVRAPYLWIGDKKTYPRGRNPVYACIDFECDGHIYRTHAYYDQILPANIYPLPYYQVGGPNHNGIMTVDPRDGVMKCMDCLYAQVRGRIPYALLRK